MSIEGYAGGKPDTGWWMAQIRQGIAFRKKYAHENQWPAWRRYYRGEFPVGIIPVNLFFRMVRTIVPRTYFRNPSISVIATKPGLEQQVFAQLIERIDNKLIRTMGVKQQMKRMVHNAFMFGTAIGKLGFGAEFTPTPEIFDTSAPTDQTPKLSRRVEYNQLVEPNFPWFMSVHPGHFIVPNMLESFEGTPWVGMWVRRPLDDVQADPRMKNTKGLKSSSGPGLRGRDTGLGEPRQNYIDLVEVRDMRTGKVMILAPYSTDKVIYYDDDAMQINRRPNYYPAIFNPDDEVFWGVPDAKILEPIQLEANETRTLQMRHRRISLVKLLYKTKTIAKEELEKLLNGDVMAAVEVLGELSDIDTITLGGIPEGLIAADAIIQADARDTLGFSRNQSGDYASQKSHNAPTAFEAKVVDEASNIRIDERRDVLADVLVNMFEDANPIVFDKFTEEQVVQVVGPEGIPLWVAFKPAMLKSARYEMTIDPDSSVPETKDLRTQKALATYERLKTNPLIDPQLLTKYLLHELHGVQFDNMMRSVMNNAAAGVSGGTPQNPMTPEQLMQAMAAQQQGGGAQK